MSCTSASFKGRPDRYTRQRYERIAAYANIGDLPSEAVRHIGN
jgi:hypothetical protein